MTLLMGSFKMKKADIGLPDHIYIVELTSNPKTSQPIEYKNSPAIHYLYKLGS